MNDRLILSPPPAKNILLSTGEDIESAINKLNNSISTNATEIKAKIKNLEDNINSLKSLTSTNANKIESLETSINSLNESINSVNSSIDTLNKDLSDLKKSLGDAAYLNVFRSWDAAGQSKSYVTKSTYEVLATQLSDGVTEVGQYIDMHTRGRNTDYDKRIET